MVAFVIITTATEAAAAAAASEMSFMWNVRDQKRRSTYARTHHRTITAEAEIPTTNTKANADGVGAKQKAQQIYREKKLFIRRDTCILHSTKMYFQFLRTFFAAFFFFPFMAHLFFSIERRRKNKRYKNSNSNLYVFAIVIAIVLYSKM